MWAWQGASALWVISLGALGRVAALDVVGRRCAGVVTRCLVGVAVGRGRAVALLGRAGSGSVTERLGEAWEATQKGAPGVRSRGLDVEGEDAVDWVNSGDGSHKEVLNEGRARSLAKA